MNSPKFRFLGLGLGVLVAAAAAGGCGDDGPGASPDAGSGPGADAAPGPAVGLTVLDVERPVDLTPDGRTALLWTQSTGDLLFYDTVAKTQVVKTTLDTAVSIQTQQPFALSQSGRIAAIYGYPPEQAGLWDEARDWVTLASPLAGCIDDTVDPPRLDRVGGAFDVSADGKVAVGLLWSSCTDSQAFLWDESSGEGTLTRLDPLGTAASIHSERATVVAANGARAAGFAPKQSGDFEIDRSPAVWEPDGSGKLLDPGANGVPGEATVISADGSVVGGILAGELGGQTGFTWTEAGGLVRFGTDTPDVDTLYVNAMTADGVLTFGLLSHPTDPTDPVFSPREESAFVRSEARGLRRLQDLAIAAGVTIPGTLVLTNVQAVSADGTVILGSGVIPPANPDTDQPVPKVYLLVLPPGALD